MAAGWDEDGPRLRANLRAVLEQIALAAQRRRSHSVEDARGWQR